MAEPVEAAATEPEKKEELGRKERRQLKEQARIDELLPLLKRMEGEDADDKLEALRELRTQMEGAHPPPLDIVIHAGFVPKLLELGQLTDKHETQFEALWVLSDLTGGDERHTKEVVDLGAVDSLQPLLLSSSASAREQALIIFGNIAGASVELRDKVMASTVVKDVLRMLHVGMANEHQTYYDEQAKVWKLRAGEPEQPVSVTRRGAQCVSRLCQGEPQPALGEGATDLLMALATLVMETDEEVLVHACTGLAALKYGAFETEFMVKDGVDARLADLGTHKSADVSALAKSAAEKIAAGKSG